MTIPGWRDGSWDRLDLDNERVPGVVRVWARKARDVQSVASPGKDAPALKDQGNKGGSATIEIDVWTSRTDTSQIDRLAAILAKLDPKRPGGVKTPVAASHPALALAGITHLASATYEIPPPNGRSGILTITIEALEWFPEEDTNTSATSQDPAAPQGGAGENDGGPLDFGDVPPPDPENLGASFP